MSLQPPLLGVTMGDPAGIGSEIIVKSYPRIADEANLVVLGDRSVLAAAVEACDSDLELNTIETVEEASFTDGVLDVVDFDNVDSLHRGEISAEYGEASLEYVERGIELAVEDRIDGLVTAPIHKQAISRAGSEFSGHTDLLATRTNTENHSMMLVQQNLVVSHVTAHVPLREALDRITTESVFETIRVTDESLRNLGIDDPSIAVAGLNPHAGDGGLGEEDDAEIEPAVTQAQTAGIDAAGPYAPDQLFKLGAYGEYDAIVAMYHDQGHIPFYLQGMVDVPGAVGGVNITIGLPIVRTGTIHGTAFDIAGTGIARSDTFVDAMRTAAQAATDDWSRLDSRQLRSVDDRDSLMKPH